MVATNNREAVSLTACVPLISLWWEAAARLELLSTPTWYHSGMLTYFRIAVTALSLTACVLLIVLWVRSHRAEDRVQGRFSSVGIRLYSSRGWVVLFKNSTPGAGPYTWDITLGGDYWLSPGDNRLRYALPLNFFGPSVISNISLPHWLLALASIAFATLPWLRWRFSLRTLLIATALVAVVLGILVTAR